MIFCDWLLSLPTVFSSLIHVAACISASLHYMSKWYSTVWTDHILLINLLSDGHLGCFHFGAIINNATMNISVHVFMCSVFLDSYPGVEWLGHIATLWITCEELSDSFSISNVPFYILTSMYEVSNFFTCSPVLFFFPLIWFKTHFITPFHR